MFTPGVMPINRSRGKWIEVLTVKFGAPLTVMVVSRELVSCAIHYVDRSYLCTADDSCPLCEAGVGRQFMLYVGVVHKKQLKLMRLAFQEFLTDAFHYGVCCDVSLPKRGQSYDVQTHLIKDSPGLEVQAYGMLTRVMILHRLSISDSPEKTSSGLWEHNILAVRSAAALGARVFQQRKRCA